MTGKFCRSIAAVALAGLTAIAPLAPVYGQAQAPAQAPAPNQPSISAQPQNPAPTQTQPQSAAPFRISLGPDYTRPRSPFPHLFAPYGPSQMGQPQLANSPRLDQLIHDGKLQLSLQDAITLALENNMDLSVQRYYSWMAEADMLRTKGGGPQRGVPIVSTPTAFANLPTLSFDPAFTSTLSADHRLIPVNNPLISGTGTSAGSQVQTLNASTALANFQYSQSFHTGGTLALSFNNTRATTSSTAVLFDPSVQTVASISFSQQLMNGFGLLANERYIRTAIITKHAVDAAFQQSIITDISQVEDDYWELVFARGNVDVQKHSVDLAQQLYDDNKKQVEIGTLAPIEIVRAEAQLATAQQALIIAQTAQIQQQIVLMSVITKNPTAPELSNIEIVTTDTAQAPPMIETMPLSDAVKEALAKRPDVLQARLNIQGDDVNIRATRNALLPSLTLSAFASGTGLSGNSKITTTASAVGAATVGPGLSPVEVVDQNPASPTFGQLVRIFAPATTTSVTGVSQGGLSGAASTAIRGTYPEFSAQLALNLPIRNRVAQADNVRALLSERQDQTRLQQTVNNVAVDVQNAQVTLQQDRAAVLAAQKSRELQQETLDADQKKLQLGATTIFIVVTDQSNLVAAASAEVRAEVNLAEALVNFERAMGRTLDVNNITVADAKTSVVPKDTLIPGTTVTGELVRQGQPQEMGDDSVAK